MRTHEVGLAALQDAHQIDHRVLAGHQRVERSVIVDVGLDHLAGGQHDQVLRLVAAAGGHPHAAATLHQQVDEVASDESGTAEHEDVGVTHGTR